MSIVFTVLTVSVLASLLAALVVIADKIFNNYGACELNINNGKQVLSVEGGTNLLSALATNAIFLPSACGGKATCGLCKVALGGEVGPVLPTEEPFLTATEVAEGVRLSCQVKIKKSLTVFIPEELFLVKQYDARVERITEMTYDIKEFRLALIDPKTMPFRAGQYIQIDSKPYGNITESVTRAYSIASVPSDNTGLELIIRQVPNGICTTYMHQHVREGDQVTLRGPFGDFYLREGASDLLFIAGGSGLAPVKAIIFDVLENKLDRTMTLFFGAVSKKDLYYVELFTQLEEEFPNFSYIPALSGPAPEDNWKGETGLITEVVERFVEDSNNKQAYLCGSPGMIDACVKVLRRIGILDQNIFYDKF